MVKHSFTYGPTYNAEMLAHVDRRTAPRIWTHKEHRQNFKAYRVSGHIIFTIDDERLDYTNLLIMSEGEYIAYKNEMLFGHDIENGNAPFGYQRTPIEKS